MHEIWKFKFSTVKNLNFQRSKIQIRATRGVKSWNMYISPPKVPGPHIRSCLWISYSSFISWRGTPCPAVRVTLPTVKDKLQSFATMHQVNFDSFFFVRLHFVGICTTFLSRWCKNKKRIHKKHKLGTNNDKKKSTDLFWKCLDNSQVFDVKFVHNVMFLITNTPVLNFLLFSTTRLCICLATVFSCMPVLDTIFSL